MSPLYLSEVVLSDFRTYGPESRLAIRPGSGLTIICGMNGLGKTAFFDGIEWGLTGDVRRISDRKGSPAMAEALSRMGSSHPHGVELQFSNGKTIKRTAISAPGGDQVVALLKAQSWQPPINSIAPYLRLTHLLSQSSWQRFVDRGADAQWELLKGAAGVDRLDRLRNLLSSIKVRKAFRRETDFHANEANSLEQNLSKWTQLHARQIELRALASASAAISPEDCRTQAMGILHELHEYEPEVIITLPDLPSADFLARVGIEVNSWQGRITDQLEALARQPDLVGHWEKLGQDLTAIGTQLQTANEYLRRLELEVQPQRNGLEKAKEQRDAAMKRIRDLESVVRIILQIDEARAAIPLAKERVQSIEADVAKTEGAKEVAQAALATTEKQRLRQQELNLRRQDILKSERELDELVRLLEQLMPLKIAADAAISETESVAVHLSRIRSDIDSCRTTISLLDQENPGGDIRGDKLGEAESGMIQALTFILSRIGPVDTRCPVCSHEHAAGDLRKAVEASLVIQEQETPSPAIRRAALAAQRLSATENLEALLRSERIEVAKLQAEEKMIERYRSLRRRIEIHPTVVNFPSNEVESLPDRRRSEIKSLWETLSSDIEAEPTGDALEQAHLEAANAVQAAEQQAKTLTARLSTVRQELTQQQAILDANRTLLAEIATAGENTGQRLASLQNKINEDQNLVQETKAAISKFESEVARYGEEIVKVQTQIAVLDGRRKSSISAQKRFEENWIALNFDGVPNAAVLSERENKLLKLSDLGKRCAAKLQKLAEGLTMWDKNQDLIRVADEISAIAQYAASKGIPATTEGLRGAAELARSKSTQGKQALAHAIASSATLNEQAERFSSAALAPLNERIARFNSVLSPFDFRYEVAAKVRPTSSDIQHKVNVALSPGGQMLQRDPIVLLSEGQSSALGLSVLFAAATEYPWSRWPALLMDDPLQNNDLIHASAFVDVVRGLILDRGFQVVLSTHDMDEADFIARKCLRGGVAVDRIELLGPSPDGVRLRQRQI